jgi:hypothetical protein
MDPNNVLRSVLMFLLAGGCMTTKFFSELVTTDGQSAGLVLMSSRHLGRKTWYHSSVVCGLLPSNGSACDNMKRGLRICLRLLERAIWCSGNALDLHPGVLCSNLGPDIGGGFTGPLQANQDSMSFRTQPLPSKSFPTPPFDAIKYTYWQRRDINNKKVQWN